MEGETNIITKVEKVKVKDRRRVELGMKLAAISRETKVRIYVNKLQVTLNFVTSCL